MPDEYDEYDEYGDEVIHEFIKVEFSLSANAFEDISVVVELTRVRWEQIKVEFRLVKANYYNFENIAAIFQITSGIFITDIPVIFSVIRPPMSYASYIMQKLYCVTTVYDGDIELFDWNVRPNKTWYVSVEGYLVKLFETKEDMDNNVNPIMQGTADATTLQVVLSYIDEYEGDVELYYQDIEYHLTISGPSLPDEYDAGIAKFKIKPLTDMSEIRDPIYNNSNIVLFRGEAELELHTNVVRKRDIVLGTHLPELEVGDVVSLTSIRRILTNENSQVLSQTITGTTAEDGTTSLVNTIQVATYMELYR
jgi:hypothetical protein